MASTKDFVDYIVEQLESIELIRAKSMFGEYGLFGEGKIFALICNNKLFIKPTAAGKSFIGEVVEAPPYPGAKNCYLIEAKLEDRDWLSTLVRISLKELPDPKPRRKKKK
jgi:TfoX/Sxy family transcriptional regulator of competence genes